MTMAAAGKTSFHAFSPDFLFVSILFPRRIIALNYVAKARGVKRSMRGDEAKKQCPELELVRVPVIRGKADLSKYRNAGKQVAAVLQTFTPLMTRASVDEAYLDLTERVQNRLADMNKVSVEKQHLFSSIFPLQR